ncbi:MAG: hypothetical protein C5B50_19930 [Verrucomicrobia bacterium]|nr:MAG: hypothetical protein C5B50_19930 [Verrucomicrobiota bacterium]
MWWFHFYSNEQDASFEVTVPAVGRIRILDHGKQYQNVNARGILVPVGQEWIDSDRAFALAEAHGGLERRRSGKTFGLFAKLQMSPSNRAYWELSYLVVDEKGRNDLIANIDAITGEPLGGI